MILLKPKRACDLKRKIYLECPKHKKYTFLLKIVAIVF